jgi:hypothetical protein
LRPETNASGLVSLLWGYHTNQGANGVKNSVDKTPRVILKVVFRDGATDDIFGRLIRTQDGKSWAMPEAYAHDRIPTLDVGYELDPSLLVSLGNSEDGTPLYIYRAEVPVLPGENLWRH